MLKRADLLIEIGTEELPPKALNRLAQTLLKGLLSGLKQAQLNHDAEQARWYATPRRLACVIPQLAAAQAEREMERRGPALAQAFDELGKPSPAAQGFARSVGVAVDQLQRLKTNKGEWLYHRYIEPGKNLGELLPGLLQHALDKLPVPKPMRWGAHETRFVRPVHWLVAVHGEQVVPLEVLGCRADRLTYGHRLHAPGPHVIAAATDYLGVLERAYVMADTAQRRERLVQQSQTLAAEVGLQPRLNPDLVEEVTALVEWPVALRCSFDKDFLQVPTEALISSMELHQKFFPLLASDGSLSAHFIAVANLESAAPERVRDGFERVVRPRLADARFFWDQDRKQALADYAPQLEAVVFQQRLGSLADKTRRVTQLADRIAQHLALEPQTAVRAAQLARCDLLTEMVGEFPELQGTMGRYYALASGESDAVAAAIDEHYSPRQAGDVIAASSAGRVLAVAEKTDTLLGIFAAGLKPTGAKDPFALRRAALGLVRTMIEGELALDLRWLLAQAAAVLQDQLGADEVLQDEVRRFVFDRLHSYWRDQGFGADAIQAVMALDRGQLADLHARLQAVREFAALSAAESLSAANKRCANILRQAEATGVAGVDPARFVDDAERQLHQAMTAAQQDVENLLAEQRYSAALSRLAQLQRPVDAFFDQVMVMVEDETLRANRLGLLAALRDLFLSIADIGKLSG